MRRLLTLALLLSLAVLMTAVSAACRVSSSDGPSPSPDVSMSPGRTPDVISWSEAASSVGQRLKVEGPVVSVRRVEGATELSLGLPAPDSQRFVALVPDKLRDRFDGPLADLFEGRLVRVTGTIAKTDGLAAIRITKPRQLRALQ